jgi:hypothetical protein
MDKYRYNRVFSGVFLAVLLFVSGCDSQITKEAGILEGVISIGPICPVETDPPAPGCLPTAETYKAYPVSVWTSDGSKKIAPINPSLDGAYSADLAPGKYLVILDKAQNRVGSSNLPVEVTILSNVKTFLNIHIDTGIR